MKLFIKIKLALIATGLLVYSCGSPKPKGAGSAVPTEIEALVPDVDLLDFFWEKTKFDFVKPNINTLDDTSKSVQIEIALEGVPSSATWSLYYNKSFLSPEEGIPIKKDMPISEVTVAWDTTKVDRGTYFLFAVIKYQTATNIRYFGSSVAIENQGEENRTPFVSISGGIVNETAYLAGDTIDIAFIAADPDGSELTFDIQYSSDSGTTWSDIKKGAKRLDEDLNYVEETGIMTYTWTVPASLPINPDYKLRIQAHDVGGKTGEGLETDTFGMIQSALTYTGSLRPLFLNSCFASCHDGSLPTGNELSINYYVSPMLGVTTGRGFLQERDDTRRNIKPDATKAMPPAGSTALTKAERDLIELWFFRQGKNQGRRLQGDAAPGSTTNTVSVPAADATVDLTLVGNTLDITWDIDTAGDTVTYDVQYSLAPDLTTFISLGNQTSPYSVNAVSFGFVSGTDPDIIVNIRIIATGTKGLQNRIGGNFNGTTVSATLDLTP